MVDLFPEILMTPERRLLRETARHVLGRLLPDERTLELDGSGEFDRAAWRSLGQAGLLGLGIPAELGGQGGSAAEAFLVTAEIAGRLPSLAVDYVLCGMTGRTLAAHGTPGQREWLAGLAAGDLLCAYGMTEPGGGTDLLALTTAATPDGDGWRVSGHKQWISLAGDADLLFVLARTDPPPAGRSRAHGLSLIAVPRDQPGVTVRRIRLAAMRAAGSYEVFLADAAAVPGGLIGPRGQGFGLLRATLNVERILSAAISLGIAVAALELTVGYARDRQAFGGPIGRFQSVQHPVADSLTEITAGALLAEKAIAAVEAGDPAASSLSGMAKLAAAETAARVTDRGMRAWGALGLSAEARMQLMFRDARLALFSPVSNEMIRNLLGESLGLPRSY